MSKVIDTEMLGDMKRFGELDVSACFSCGNCTAICPLADNDATFPRRIIRLAQVGLKDELLSSKELWTCYHCGLCSDSCPQDADPGRVHGRGSALRDRQLRQDAASPGSCTPSRSRERSSRSRSPLFFALFMYSAHGPQDSDVTGVLHLHPRPADPLDRHRGDGAHGRRRASPVS